MNHSHLVFYFCNLLNSFLAEHTGKSVHSKMPRESTITGMRNKLSCLLFEHKETMQENTYKILYECLASETQDWQTEQIWCSITYAKASFNYNNDGPTPEVDIHRRNILICRHMFEATKCAMKEWLNHACTFYNILSHNDTNLKTYLKRELDEPDLFNDREATFRIIDIVELQQ